MWQGKPVSEWTEKQQAIFLNHLTGHSFTHHYYFHTDSGFFAVKSFMERELPEVWEGYVDEEFILFRYDKREAHKCLDNTFNLSNLIQYLLDNQEGWAWKECTACTGNGDISENSIRWGVDKITCPECQGAGKVKHPALLFAEGVK